MQLPGLLSNNLADDYRHLIPTPWDGGFLTGTPFIIGNAGGRGVTLLEFQFQVTTAIPAIPEPETYALLLAGLLLLGLENRRRSSRRRAPQPLAT